MSKIILSNDDGIKIYKDALTPKEIEEADLFLIKLQKEVECFQDDLINKYNSSSLEYKYAIGEFLSNKVMSQGIAEYERQYVWQEIKRWVQTDIETTKDRSSNREFYDYCYRLYKFGKDLVFSFSWRQWSEFLDRSITTKDIRLLYWLKDQKKNIKQENLRFFLMILNTYLKTHDTSVFETDELYDKYDFLYSIVIQWQNLVKYYFNGDIKNLSKARREKLTKYKHKFVERVLKESRLKSKEDLAIICKQAFIDLFVNVDKSNNFKTK